MTRARNEIGGCCGQHSLQQGGYFFCSWQQESVIGISSAIGAAPVWDRAMT
jgi:hypothetical protein